MTPDIETVKKAVAALLGTSGFADALAAVNADQNDGYTTPGLAAIYPYERLVPEAYPVVELQGLNGVYDVGEDVKDLTHRFAIVVTQVGDNEATVTTDVERLLRAIRDFLWRSTLNGLTAPVLIGEENYSQLAAARDHPFVKGGMLILTAQTFA